MGSEGVVPDWVDVGCWMEVWWMERWWPASGGGWTGVVGCGWMVDDEQVDDGWEMNIGSCKWMGSGSWVVGG